MFTSFFDFFEKFFVASGQSITGEIVYFSTPIVILYFCITAIGAYTGLSVIKEMFRSRHKKTKNFLHFYSAFVLSSGMWIMYFVGALSHDTRIGYHYDIAFTLSLIFLTTIPTFLFVYVIRHLKPNMVSYCIGTILLSSAILIMNYIGMIGQSIDADFIFISKFVFVSIIFALAASLITIVFLFRLKTIKKNKSRWTLITSLIVGSTIFCVHYIGMKSTIFIPNENCCGNLATAASNYTPDGAIIAGVIFSIALIIRIIYWKVNFTGKKKNFWNYVPKMILLVGVVVSALSLVGTYDIYLEKNKMLFLRYIKDTENALFERYSRYEQALKGAKGLYSASQYVSHKEWVSFVTAQNIEETLSGINGIGFIKYVEEQNLDQFINLARTEIPNFKNHPKTEYKNKFIIKYIEPYNKNSEAIGLDIGFEKNRREAAEISRVTNKPTLTRKINLVQDDIKRSGFLLILPLNYEDKDFQGWVYAPFIGESFFHNLLEISNQEISFSVYDGTLISNENIIYQDKNYADKYLKRQIEHTTEVSIAGRIWTIKWQSTPSFHSSVNHVSLFIQLLVGLAITALLAMIAHTQNTRTKKVEQLVEEKTRELGAERQFSELIIKTIPDYFFVKDKNFKIVQANDVFLSLYPEEKRDKIIGTTAIENHTSEDAKEFLAEDKRAFDTGISKTIENLQLLNGKSVTLDTTKVRFENENGEEFILGLARDVTELQNTKDYLEVLVQERTKELEKANASKDMFLANMSHELRTPLNSILGLIKLLLLEERVPDDYKETLRVIEKSATSLLEIVNDILDLSKLEAEKVELENRPFNISGLMHSAIEMVKPLAEQKEIDFKTNINELAPVNVIGDEFRLTRVILNLISNAIKYTEEGFVKVYIEINEIAENHVEFMLNVQDTGIGIAENKIEHIFKKFSQAEESTERKFGGTGLGLHITKTLVNLMNGSIKVKSELNQGSIFTIKIPFEATEQDAVEHFKISEYDIILMDCHMPKLNGYHATKEIRKLEKERNQKLTPIVAMTADAMSGTKESCIRSGMDDYISKPIDIEYFRTVLERWFLFDSPPIEEEISTERPNKNNAPINLDILNSYTDGDEEQNKMLLKSFYEKAMQDLELLSQYIITGESEEWSRHSHSLKGASSYVGAQILYDLAEEAQEMKTSTKKERKDILDKMVKSYEKILQHLKDNDYY